MTPDPIPPPRCSRGSIGPCGPKGPWCPDGPSGPNGKGKPKNSSGFRFPVPRESRVRTAREVILTTAGVMAFATAVNPGADVFTASGPAGTSATIAVDARAPERCDYLTYSPPTTRETP